MLFKPEKGTQKPYIPIRNCYGAYCRLAANHGPRMLPRHARTAQTPQRVLQSSFYGVSKLPLGTFSPPLKSLKCLKSLAAACQLQQPWPKHAAKTCCSLQMQRTIAQVRCQDMPERPRLRNASCKAGSMRASKLLFGTFSPPLCSEPWPEYAH